MHYSKKFVGNGDYIFYAYSVLQKIKLSSQIEIERKKVISNILTAGMLSKRVKELMSKDKAFSFMSSIKGTPAYWKKFLHQVLAMVK